MTATGIPPINTSSSWPPAPTTTRPRLRATLAAAGAMLILAVTGCASAAQDDETAVDGITSGSQAEGADGLELRDVVFDVRRDPG